VIELANLSTGRAPDARAFVLFEALADEKKDNYADFGL